MAKKKYYAVRTGRLNGVIVNSWDECRKLVDGYKGAIFKSFTDYAEAFSFSQSGSCKNQLKKKSRQAAAQTKTGHSWNNDLYPCVERKSYKDPMTGVYFKNRCVKRKGPTVTGKLYKPHIGTSCPF